MVQTLGPADGRLTVRTGKTGAAAKAGHDLLIEVGSWQASLDLEAGSMSLSADSASLRVLEGTGGIQGLGKDDKAGINETIDKEVMKGGAIAFESTMVIRGSDALSVSGVLDLLGVKHPLSFELALDGDGHLTGGARIKQTDWKIKPYSALFGTLKVADEIEVGIDARLPHMDNDDRKL